VLSTNYVGAKNELKALHELMNDSSHQELVCNAVNSKEIQFHFIPPRAPHFGGLWEAAGKSMKYHLTRIVGNVSLTFEELTTVLTKIEAILNSRPLDPKSNDPEDTTSLTPGHFLIGRSLTALIEPNYSDTNINSLRCWQLLQQLTQHFWKRCLVDYLTSLQRRTKRTDEAPPFYLEMIALLKDDNLPATQWNLGRIVDMHPGADDLMKTKTEVFKRPIVKVCMLPLCEDNH
jgi:hypothetical protein